MHLRTQDSEEFWDLKTNGRKLNPTKAEGKCFYLPRVTKAHTELLSHRTVRATEQKAHRRHLHTLLGEEPPGTPVCMAGPGQGPDRDRDRDRGMSQPGPKHQPARDPVMSSIPRPRGSPQASAAKRLMVSRGRQEQKPSRVQTSRSPGGPGSSKWLDPRHRLVSSVQQLPQQTEMPGNGGAGSDRVQHRAKGQVPKTQSPSQSQTLGGSPRTTDLETGPPKTQPVSQ